MNFLITGGAGFIGSHLCEYILENTDNTVTILDRLDTTSSLKRLPTKYIDRLKFVWWDLKSEFNNSIKNELQIIDIVIHMAASSHVDRSIINPLSFIMDNVVGTCNLLNWIRFNKRIKLLLHCSTDEVFGSSIFNKSYEDNDATFPENPYSASKAGAESLVIAYASTYKIPAVIARMTNVIGIKQHPEKFIPMVIRKILNNEEIHVFCNEDCTKIGTRYYIDVRDICNGIMTIVLHSYLSDKYRIRKDIRFNGIYHISGKENISNLEVVNQIKDQIPSLKNPVIIKYESYPSNRPYHDLNYCISDLTMKYIGWYPQVTFKESIKDIVNWYLKNPEWLDEFKVLH
jgi:dTDP-glucose 4,6-dehydratase